MSNFLGSSLNANSFNLLQNIDTPSTFLQATGKESGNNNVGNGLLQTALVVW